MLTNLIQMKIVIFNIICIVSKLCNHYHISSNMCYFESNACDYAMKQVIFFIIISKHKVNRIFTHLSIFTIDLQRNCKLLDDFALMCINKDK